MGRYDKGACSLGQCQLLRTSTLALQVELESDPGDSHWIPKSVIHDDSEVYDESTETGELVVFNWFAEKEGLD